MDDLHESFRAKLAAGVTAIHPHGWLLREAQHPMTGSWALGMGSRIDMAELEPMEQGA